MGLRALQVFACVCVCVLATAGAGVRRARSAPRGELYLDIIDMAAISRMSPAQLETLAEGLAAEEIMRTKRSSAAAVSALSAGSAGSKSSGLQNKLGLLGQASAFISSASSKSGGDHGYSYDPPHDEKYDYWGLKKSILYTLFQAVKAITGGVTILKGQLIKGGGALASTLGKVIAGKGDAVSNLGKKIVSSAALSEKKPHSTAVYGPPPTSHIEYGPPAVYGAPTAPAHVYHTGPSLPTGYAAHKYPATLDGRGAGVQAGLVLLAPLGGHTALEPPPSVLNTVFSAIKNAFSTVAASSAPSAPASLDEPYSHPPSVAALEESYHHPPSVAALEESYHHPPSAAEEPYSHQPPPPPQPAPEFKPGWSQALDSYGAPAAPAAFSGYDANNPLPPFDYAAAKHSSVHKTGLTPDKIQKINFNLAKLNHYMSQARSSEALPQFGGLAAARQLLQRGPQLPTPVITDLEPGVLPAALLPDLEPSPAATHSPATPVPTPASTAPPTTTVADTRRTDYKYYLRGNRIVLV